MDITIYTLITLCTFSAFILGAQLYYLNSNKTFNY